MQLNGQSLLGRYLNDENNVLYVFAPSERSEALISEWTNNATRRHYLSTFANLVSREIRAAAKLRYSSDANKPHVDEPLPQ